MAGNAKPSWRVALDRANESRSGAAALKEEVRLGHLRIEDAVTDPRAASIPLRDFLMLYPRWGREWAAQVCRLLGASEERRLRQLTDRQREEVRGALAAVRVRGRYVSKYDAVRDYLGR